MSEAKVDTDRPKAVARPLSPHLLHWRWHVTLLASITHRATGMILYVAVLIIAGWCAALAAGPDAYGLYREILGSILGKLVLLGITFSVFYHLAGGLRHLFWDVGVAFAPRTAETTAMAALAFGAAATAAVWIIAGFAGML
jgi:succinate dehydrogenase / fumarate reductase cytochrome b subunit